MREVARRHGLQVIVVDKDDYVDLQVLVVPEKLRGRGLGTSFMKEVCEEADRKVGAAPKPTLESWVNTFAS